MYVSPSTPVRIEILEEAVLVSIEFQKEFKISFQLQDHFCSLTIERLNESDEKLVNCGSSDENFSLEKLSTWIGSPR